MHYYLINAYCEKGDMLPNTAPCGGLEAYQIWGVKMEKNLESICMEGRSLFTFDLIFLGQLAMPRGPAFSEQYFLIMCWTPIHPPLLKIW